MRLARCKQEGLPSNKPEKTHSRLVRSVKQATLSDEVSSMVITSVQSPTYWIHYIGLVLALSFCFELSEVYSNGCYIIKVRYM